jgi:Tfp pilus assembly protein PilX
MQKKQSNNESGIALVITLLLMLLVLSLVSGFIVLIMSGQQLTGLSNGQTRAFYGAEAGMENDCGSWDVVRQHLRASRGRTERYRGEPSD